MSVKALAVRFDAALRVRLRGALGGEFDGTVVDSPPWQRPWAMFAYLALSRGRFRGPC